jgi:Holliday junction resolvase RusA-like endonuclease
MGNYRLELELPLARTDANKTRGMNKFKLYSIHKKIKDQIYKQSLGKLPAAPLTSFQISVHRFSSKFMDYDNLISSLKPALDGCTLAKIIKDDKWEFIKHINVEQTKSKEKKIIITVEEI